LQTTLGIFCSMKYSHPRKPASLGLLPLLNENPIETSNSGIRICIPSNYVSPNSDRVNLLHWAWLLHLVSYRQDFFRHTLAVISPPPQRLGQGQTAAHVLCRASSQYHFHHNSQVYRGQILFCIGATTRNELYETARG
jgi:hypothetical protein